MRKFKRNIQQKQKGKQKSGHVTRRLAEAQGLMQTGRLREAEVICRHILAEQPRHAAALSLLASIALAAGNNQAVIDIGRQAVLNRSPDENVYILMGIASYNLGLYDEAIHSYQKALAINDRNALTYYNLGNAYKIIEEYPDAIKAYRSAILLKPDYFKAYNNLGNVYTSCSMLGEAEECLRKAVKLNPAIAEVHNNLASVFGAQKRLEEAVECYEKARQINPGDQVATAGLAMFQVVNKNYEQAYGMIAPLLQQEVKEINSRVVDVYAAICHAADRQKEAVDLLERIERESRLSRVEERSLHFNLGTLYDDLQDYAKAFGHFRKGNALKKVRFVPADHLQWYRSIMDMYSKGKLADSGNKSTLPVFIVGMPRSGTSLVEQILASHPAVYGAGELYDVTDLANRLPSFGDTEKRYPAGEEDITRTQLEELSGEYLASLISRYGIDENDIKHITDKMPHNFQYIGLIRRLFPNGTIIHCRRNPLDTCLSCYCIDFQGSHPYAYDLRNLGIAYRHYEYLMRFWRDTMQIPMLEIHYEELVGNQEEISRQMLAYCGLEWDERCLEFHKSDRLVHTASMYQVRKPIYTKSADRWRNYEQFLGPLQVELDRPVD